MLVSEGYSVRDVTKLLGLSRSIVSGFIAAGFVSPARGPRGEYRFSFPDLVVLRTAQALTTAKLPPARIVRSLKRLRARLPNSVPLSGLKVEAIGDSVVVNDGSAQWRPDDGQYVLRFAVESSGGRLSFLEPATPQPARVPAQWFEEALSRERDEDIDAACKAYRNAIAEDETHLHAYINLGRCLHASGRLEEAERVYRKGLARCGPDETLLFNLAVLLEDLERLDDAVDAYRAAVERSPEMADAHYNLALLCERQGRRQEALRHLNAYRKLQR